MTGGNAAGGMSRSACGKIEFDRYMRRHAPFPYSPMNPVDHEVNLWNGRKFRIKFQRGGPWQTGTVIGLNQPVAVPRNT